MPSSDRGSPTLVEHSPEPPHTFLSPEAIALSVLSPPASRSTTTSPVPEPAAAEAPEPALNGEDEHTSHAAASISDDSSNPDSNSDSSTSTETPGTISTPRSTAQDSGMPIPSDTAAQPLAEPNHEDAPTDTASDPTDVPTTSERPDEPIPPPDRSDTPDPPPPPPPEPELPAIDNTPEWVKYEEDTSSPTDEELKAIQTQNELDASVPADVEKLVFPNLDEPEYRPAKKIRLSWTIKGVRGTRDKPNRARVMSSPSVCIDGNYWNIKFFPRGNKSRNSLSAFVRCSPVAPELPSDELEGSFKCWEALPDVDFSTVSPVLGLELTPPTIPEKEEQQPKDAPAPAPANQEASSAEDKTEPPSISPEDAAVPPPPPPPPSDPQDDDDDDDDSSEDEDIQTKTPHASQLAPEFRVSAQLGMVIYNPCEPRTNHDLSAEHQFCPHQDDWGWDSAVSHWEDIHRRKRGQRQALLRNDTLVIDAYIRIFHDSTKALFWHSSSGESQWDAKSLAGFHPFGTRHLYHSPATAGIASWFLLAPIRQVVQQTTTSKWHRNSAERPRPLFAQLQLMLYQMRHMKRDESYIHLDNVIHELTRPGESFNDVRNFWEVFRRALELELADDVQSKAALQELLGDRDLLYKLPLLPVKTASTIQEGVNTAFKAAQVKSSFPNLLPLLLDRQSFDATAREWKLHHDRVKIDEELDLSAFSSDEDSKYTLYGFVVHDGERSSGKFFSVLRPDGPGGKWLQFTDGNGNKVHSLTRRKVEQFFGLESAELRNASSSSTQTVYMALYLRASRFSECLPAAMEPYRLPRWLQPMLEESCDNSADNFTEEPDVDADALTPVEVFWDRSISGHQGKIDLIKMKTNQRAQDKQYHQILKAHPDTSFDTLKQRIADVLGMSTSKFKLWCINYYRSGAFSKGYMYLPLLDSKIRTSVAKEQNYQLWMAIKPPKEEEEGEAKEDAAPADAPAAPSVEVDAEAPISSTEDALTADNAQKDTDEAGELAEDLSIEERFLKLSEIVIEAPPKPEPKPDSPEPALDKDDAVEGQDTTNTNNADGNVSAESSVDTNTSESTSDDTTHTSTDAERTEESSTPPGDTNTASDGQAAGPDEEQASVQEAVQNSVGITDADTENTTTLAEVSASNNNGNDHASNAAADDEQAAVQEAIALSLGLGADQSNVPQGIENAAHVPNPETSSPIITQAPEETAPAPIPSENDVLSTSPDVATIPTDNLANDTIDLPVEHGHLVDAAEHMTSLPRRPLTAIITAGDNQILIVQNPGTTVGDEISAEDAAVIQAMIAEDLALAERGRGEEVVEETREDSNTDSRPSTPRPRILDVYGFLQVFDAEKQTVVTHGMFTWASDQLISAMAKKYLEYDEEQKFQIWRRSGTFSTTAISLESSFKDLSIGDCCEIIVGAELSEATTEQLKSRGEFVDPGKLMRYMAMCTRSHPLLSTTTSSAVEVNDFGGDYYRGPLVGGQKHGKKCMIITSSGSTYDGPLVCGAKSGVGGKMIYDNGDEYTGDWLDDQRHGQGEFVEKRTGNKYVGGYESDKRWGKGVTYWEVADQQADLCQICYFNEVDVLFYKCGHICACYDCAKQCDCCPICRKSIDAVVKMYRS